MVIERRVVGGGSLRASSERKNRIIGGYAAVFNSLSEPIGGPGAFREQIDRNAFNKWLSSKDADARCLANHDPNLIFGRQKSGTLSLTVDDTGLQYTCKLPPTAAADDVYELIRRGDITGSSFGFETIEDSWNDITNTRTLLEVNLFDVAPVVFPAYPQSSVQVRSATGEMQTIKVGFYRSTRSLQVPSASAVTTDAQRRAKARDLLREMGVGSDDPCSCPCSSCADDKDCGSCDCSEGCEGEGCRNEECACALHRSVYRQRQAPGRTIVPAGTSIAELQAEQLERELTWSRLLMKAASAR